MLTDTTSVQDKLGSIAAVAAAVIAAAACTASPGSPSGSLRYHEALAFAQCMRADGARGFPDPDSNGQFSGNGIDQNSSQVQAAGVVCGSSQPGQNPAAQLAQAQVQALRFSRCMRAHGIPSFPDPSVQSAGGISVTIRMPASAGSGGIDPRSPQFGAAQQACRPILLHHGHQSRRTSHNGSGG